MKKIKYLFFWNFALTRHKNRCILCSMRQVTIRQFQRCLYKEIKNLPVIVTRRKKPFFIVQNAQKVVNLEYIGSPNTEIKGLKDN